MEAIDKRLMEKYLYHTVPIMIICGWVWSVAMAIPPLLGCGSYRPDDNSDDNLWVGVECGHVYTSSPGVGQL